MVQREKRCLRCTVNGIAAWLAQPQPRFVHTLRSGSVWRAVSQAVFCRLIRALVSGAVAELASFGLVRQVGSGRMAPYEAVMDVWPIISGVLREREWMLLETARITLEGAITELERVHLESPREEEDG